MKETIEISTLKRIEFSTAFQKPKNEEDNFEFLTKHYPCKTLDIFDTALEINSEEIKLLDSSYFKLISEEKYLKFIVEVFQENASLCSVNIEAFKNANYEFIVDVSNKLDSVDRYILLNQLAIITSSSQSFYLVDDENLLKMLFKCMLRELIPMELYFNVKPLAIFSNYDLSIPIVFKDEKDVKYYLNMAERNALYLR
ncbi:MAG TPA: hypothetical protein EYG80_05810 [Flavobacteriaceae bacterium]|nr:hypothetical protein [Flavobacteriaceae bacterium]